MKILEPQIPTNLNPVNDLIKLLDQQDDLTELLIDNQVATGAQAKSRSISDSIIIKSDLSMMDMDKFDIVNCAIKNSDLSGSKFPDSSWKAISIDGCRCSGLQVQNSSLKEIRFFNSKLDIVNFRFATMENVIFEDCVLDDADFYGAMLKNIEFINCTIAKITFASAKMRNVNLSKSVIESMQGINSLKGSTINYDQLMQLAPYFAAEAGIKIS